MALTVVAVLVAATHDGAARADSYRAAAASILLLLGMAVAVVLGASAVNRDAEAGFLGLMVGSGMPRGRLALGRLGARLTVLLATVAIWGVALQLGSLALGRGLDGPLAIHTLASVENLLLVLICAAAVSTMLGPWVAGLLGVFVFVVAQAFVQLKAASDQSVIGAVARPGVSAAYWLLPRAVSSPMIADLQNRGQGGAAAPRFEVNGALVRVPAAGWDTVLWTLLWCGVFAAAMIAGLRRREL